MTSENHLNQAPNHPLPWLPLFAAIPLGLLVANDNGTIEWPLLTDSGQVSSGIWTTTRNNANLTRIWWKFLVEDRTICPFVFNTLDGYPKNNLTITGEQQPAIGGCHCYTIICSILIGVVSDNETMERPLRASIQVWSCFFTSGT